MPGEETAAVAKLTAQMDMHLDNDKLVHRQLADTGTAILQEVKALSAKLDSAIQRVHERVDSKADATDVAKAMEKATSAHTRIDREKNKLLLAVIGWFVSGGALVGIHLGGKP